MLMSLWGILGDCILFQNDWADLNVRNYVSKWRIAYRAKSVKNLGAFAAETPGVLKAD